MHPPTVEDVARVAGVSRQTVSNVLNAPQRVRPETRERVEAAIAKLGYRPNRMAQSLQAATSRMIGYRIKPADPHGLSSIHDRLLHAMSEAGRAADHHMLLFTANDEDEVANVQALHRAGAIDGVVLYGIGIDDPRPPALRRLRIPFAAFGRTGVDSDHPWVDIDNAAGTAAAVEHLVELGHRRIAFVSGTVGAAVADRCAEGWRTALDKHGLLDGSHGLNLRGEDTIATGERFGDALLDHADPPTAVVGANDTLAIGVLRAARRRGARLAVVGFDDTPAAVAMDLSSVRQPIEAVGHAIIRALLNEGGPTGLLLNPELVVRASSALP
ncbi:LacI family transcriptional regulator [Nonomuraea sp. NBC_00507]|uniref:LacI family DNA-binding transcriptional regulator n=1 Tax=Nonomuraea sp. NBC_00507 TaxID=2976002 RepID=UPI002E19BBAE